ncbi:MAG: trypsin-like peptidase domain-containing protein [Oscillospiraceae bacterium]|nr:trypsin-like peptidase domain-containing protein [Oscillospiraceae bacterium]
MYENNYNYIEVPEEKKKRSGAGRTVAVILAAALAGGAAGYGGSYLANRTQAVPAVEQTAAAEEDTSSSGDAAPAAAATSSPVDLIHTGSTSSEGELTTQQIVKKVSPSVVIVRAEYNNGNGGTGTGIILSKDGYIITNAHVVQTQAQEYVNGNDGYNPFGDYGNNGGYGDIFSYFFGGGSYKTVTKQADKVTIFLNAEDETGHEAEIIGLDTNSDIAVLKIDATDVDLTPAEIGSSDDLEMGDTAIVIGYPLGLGLSTSQGIVSGLNRTLDMELSVGGSASMTLIQTDAAINAGNSGGPLVNSRGQVVGITSSKLSSTSIEGVCFAIPITDIMPIISQLMNNGYVATPQLGITGANVNKAVARYYGLPVDKGVMVVTVNEGGAAEAAGICAGDVIVAADGKDVSSMEELTEIKGTHQAGDTMEITLARADGNETVQVVLGEGSEPEQEN